MSTTIGGSANLAAFHFRVRDASAGEFRVTAFDGSEGLSELFDIRVRLASEEFTVEPERLLGKAAVLSIDNEQGTRAIHGIIRRFERIEDAGRVTHYEARLVPPHWLLTRRIQSRVFNPRRCKRMDVIGIVSKVLEDAGMDPVDLIDLTIEKYEEREFVVQYRESDWSFVSRLLEDEGIYYYFDHLPDRIKLVLVDQKGVHGPYERPDGRVPYREASSLVAERDFVYHARLLHDVRIGNVELDDFNFRRPTDELRTEAQARQFTALTLADYPGGYIDRSRGRRLSRVRLEEEQAARRVLSMKSSVRGFWPGGCFTLHDHPVDSFNIVYLITRVTHRATQFQSAEAASFDESGSRYDSELRVIPADVQFRPPRITPKAAVRGSQTAIVVGPPNEEIHTDEYGRVEVLFHWDQEWPADVGASCWIRVSQGWAGGQYGMLFLPRVGHEVIVDFLEGDPDQPIITGRVYNRDHMPPYPLPAEKTKSTIKTLCSPADKRYHELRFEDARGAEQFFIRAQRRMDTRVVGPHFHTVCGSLHELIGGQTREGPKGGYYRTAYENVDLRAEEGSQLEFIKRLSNFIVGEDATDAYRQSYRLAIEQKLEAVVKNRIVMTSDEEILFYVGNNFVRITKAGVQIHGEMIWLNDDKALKLDGIEAREIDLPLKAAPADDGQPGRARRGGPARPRVREKLLLDGRKGPEVIPPKKPDPPPPSKGLKITAECAHQPRGTRRIVQRQTLGVVPSPQQKSGDFMLLTAESTPPAPTQPDWTISSVGTRKGEEVVFDAAAPAAPSPKHTNWYWNPKAGTKNRYHVTCKDGNGLTEWLNVDAYPYVRELCFDRKSVLGYIHEAAKKITDLLDFLDVDAVKVGQTIDGRGKAGWKEDPDGGVSFVFDFDVKMDPIIEANVEKTIPLKKLIERWKSPASLVLKHLVDLDALVKVSGKMACNMHIEGSYRDGKGWTYTSTGGVSGEIVVTVGIIASATKDVAKVTGTLNGVLTIEGAPFADDSGFGFGLAIVFAGVKGDIEIELKYLPDPPSVTFWLYKPSDAKLFGPRRVYIPLDECGDRPPPPPPPPDDPDKPDPPPWPDFPTWPDPRSPFPKQDPLPPDLPLPPSDRCPTSSCHEHPGGRPKRTPQPQPQPPSFDPRLI